MNDLTNFTEFLAWIPNGTTFASFINTTDANNTEMTTEHPTLNMTHLWNQSLPLIHRHDPPPTLSRYQEQHPLRVHLGIVASVWCPRLTSIFFRFRADHSIFVSAATVSCDLSLAR
jgi:hypothetical protein